MQNITNNIKDNSGAKSGLIGYTGFVGSNLLNQRSFNFLYNSASIEKIKEESFDYIVCAGAPGTQWLANKYPDKDLASINKLIDCLDKAKIETLVLISTIAVYPTPINVDEDSKIDPYTLNTYGKNRLKLESILKERFKTTILRLPALFGKGLKKNVLFDLIKKKNLEKINLNSTYQFYNLENINYDIELALNQNLDILNLATEPVKLEEIVKLCFDYKIKGNLKSALRQENMITKFAKKLNKKSKYLYFKNEIIDDIKSFIDNQ